MCARSRIGFFAPVPRSRATRLPLRGAGVKTRTSAAGNPALRSRAAIASAAFAVSPVAVTVLISTSSFQMSRARRWWGERDCAAAMNGTAKSSNALAVISLSPQFPSVPRGVRRAGAVINGVRRQVKPELMAEKLHDVRFPHRRALGREQRMSRRAWAALPRSERLVDHGAMGNAARLVNIRERRDGGDGAVVGGDHEQGRRGCFFGRGDERRS